MTAFDAPAGVPLLPGWAGFGDPNVVLAVPASPVPRPLWGQLWPREGSSTGFVLGENYITLTQAAYDALTSPAAGTLYVITS